MTRREKPSPPEFDLAEIRAVIAYLPANVRLSPSVTVTASSSSPSFRPDVILDFSVEDGLLTVHLKNIGSRSGYLVKTTFDKPFLGLGGTKPISEMRVFRNVDFMPPGKAFAQFVDSLSGYAKRKQPMRLVATVSYRDREGSRFEERFAHDLRIYLELGTATAARHGRQGD